MIQQEDIDEVAFPRLVVTLYLLQTQGISIEWDFIENLKVSPLPEGRDIEERVMEHFEHLKALQPGDCDECGAWALKRVRAYWGPKPMFCVICWKRRLLSYQRSGEWPPAEFDVEL